MNFHYEVPDNRKIRLMINTDAKNEADDQYAIVHALLTPKFLIKGIIAAHFGNKRFGRVPVANSMEDSYQEIKKVLSLMDMDDRIDVWKGAERALSDEKTPATSEGAKKIIEEAMKDDPHPLFVIFLGPLTDLASAYLMEPRIADRLTAVWIGGGQYPDGCREFNLGNDIHAANVVFASDIPLWQIPINAYRLIKVSLAELEDRVRPYGKIGRYLFDQLVETNLDPAWGLPFGESWCLGDSPAVSLLIDHHRFHYREIPAPRITEEMTYVQRDNQRKIRVYDFVDPRFTLEDMFAKIKLFARQGD